MTAVCSSCCLWCFLLKRWTRMVNMVNTLSTWWHAAHGCPLINLFYCNQWLKTLFLLLQSKLQHFTSQNNQIRVRLCAHSSAWYIVCMRHFHRLPLSSSCMPLHSLENYFPWSIIAWLILSLGYLYQVISLSGPCQIQVNSCCPINKHCLHFWNAEEWSSITSSTLQQFVNVHFFTNW